VGELTKEIWIDAPPEKVFRYLVEPELTVRWFGTTTVEWDLEAVDGGTRVRLWHSGLTEEGVERHSEAGTSSCPSLRGRPRHELAERVRGVPPRAR
jgi:uncharacterized protein YndB with AHSA1/START domain